MLRGVLFVDDAVPHAALGAGHPRGAAILRELAAIAPRVAVVATQGGSAAQARVLPAHVEVLGGAVDAAIVAGLRNCDVAWIGRPHNLALVEQLARRVPDLLAGVRVIYDAEAVFALRDARKRALDGTPMSPTRQRSGLRQEFHAAHVAHAIAAVSEAERRVIAELTGKPVHVLAYPAPLLVEDPQPHGRAGMLFVGNLERPREPNGDGLRWLLREAWPALAERFRSLSVVGRGAEPNGWLAEYATEGVRLLGSVDDLRSRYAEARLFIAPTRYASGIPLKVIEAAQHGLPVVATPLLAELLGWRDGVELCVAHDAPSFARAIARLAQDDALWRSVACGAQAALARAFDPEAFGASLRSVVARAAAL